MQEVDKLFAKIMSNGLPVEEGKSLFYTSLIRTGIFSHTFWILGRRNPLYKGLKLTLNNENMVCLHLVDEDGNIIMNRNLGYNHAKFFGNYHDHTVPEKVYDELLRAVTELKMDDEEFDMDSDVEEEDWEVRFVK